MNDSQTLSGYRTHWLLVLKAGLAIAGIHVGVFYLFYYAGWAEANPLRAGLGSKLLAWIPTMALYGWLVWQVRRRADNFRPFLGLYYVLLAGFIWITIDALNGIYVEYYLDPELDLRMYEYSLRSMQQDVANGVVNAEAAERMIEQRKAMIALAKTGPTPVVDLLIGSFKINLLLSSIYGLILGVLLRPMRRN